MVQFKLGEITVDVIQKEIKNIHLSVYPPTGHVRISAPLRMEIDTIRVYVISKLGWIKKQQAKIKKQDREAPREFLNKESHYFRGKRYLLKIIEHDESPKVEVRHSQLILYIRPQTIQEKMKFILNEWYRSQLKTSIPSMIEKWEKKINVNVEEFAIRKMKTMWGTCNPESMRITMNLELAKKPPECLEYIVVHEMVHLLERKHNDKFKSYMDKFMPKWRFYRDELNRLPVRHEDWKY